MSRPRVSSGFSGIWHCKGKVCEGHRLEMRPTGVGRGHLKRSGSWTELVAGLHRLDLLWR